ncbi:MAG: acyltransferase [Lachnospiraceae bacterium]|nr:acyltransferase [Lachnospiraceae bacterium]
MNNNEQVEKHIDILDGIRAIAIVMVVWFHFWQQTWLTPYVTFDNHITRYLGLTEIPLHTMVRYGGNFVDVLILISAICNLYPYARAILLQEKWPDTRQFYLKRAIRILPSYYLCIIIMLIFALAEHKYTDATFMWKDIFMHLSFTAVLDKNVYLRTALNGVLWTVQVEVIYYILIPWIAKAFRRFPLLTCITLWGTGFVTCNYILYQKSDQVSSYLNYFLTFAGFYANGMLICMIYLTLKKQIAENKYLHLFSALIALGCIIAINQLLTGYYDHDTSTIQLSTRYELMLIYSIFILCIMFSCKAIRFLFANRLLKFIATISYNLYIWHQMVAVKLKSYRIPYWEGDTPPNITGDPVWQWKYQILIVVLSLIIATVLTYGFEIPVAKFLKRKLHLDRSN